MSSKERNMVNLEKEFWLPPTYKIGDFSWLEPDFKTTEQKEFNATVIKFFDVYKFILDIYNKRFYIPRDSEITSFSVVKLLINSEFIIGRLFADVGYIYITDSYRVYTEIERYQKDLIYRFLYMGSNPHLVKATQNCYEEDFISYSRFTELGEKIYKNYGSNLTKL